MGVKRFGYLQSLSHNLLLGGNLDEFADVECGYSESFRVAKFTERFRVVRRSKDHVLALEGSQAFATLDASPMEDDVGNDDGLLGVNFLLARWALLVVKSSLHLFAFKSLFFFLSDNKKMFRFN